LSQLQTENAKYIYQYFKNKGWTCEAIAGMLGNMQAESGIIADIAERGGDGFGLVQWTPRSKLINWANSLNLDYKEIEAQCRRIQWELENSHQFYSTSQYPLTFKQYTQSTKNPAYLALAFLANYERPLNSNQPIRSTYANNWYDLLVTRGGGSDTNSSNINNNSNTSTYTVKAGDTLSDIAKKYNTTVDKLKSLNQIKDVNKIYISQVLKLTTQAINTSTYTVKAGDTLSGIAVKYNTTVAKLKSLNQIKDANKIYTGQVLKLTTQAINTSTYTVKAGDTLSDIAVKYNTTVAKLKSLNQIKDANKIYIGQVLKLR